MLINVLLDQFLNTKVLQGTYVAHDTYKTANIFLLV